MRYRISLFLFLSTALSVFAAATKPHFIIMVDDMVDATGSCIDNPYFKTQEIDRLCEAALDPPRVR